jgi:plasmid stabilization system protein ParE
VKRLRFQPRAVSDLFEIWDYIAQDNVNAANRVGKRLDAAIRGLAAFSGKGHARPDVPDKAYRFWNVPPPM